VKTGKTGRVQEKAVEGLKSSAKAETNRRGPEREGLSWRRERLSTKSSKLNVRPSKKKKTRKGSVKFRSNFHKECPSENEKKRPSFGYIELPLSSKGDQYLNRNCRGTLADGFVNPPNSEKTKIGTEPGAYHEARTPPLTKSQRRRCQNPFHHEGSIAQREERRKRSEESRPPSGNTRPAQKRDWEKRERSDCVNPPDKETYPVQEARPRGKHQRGQMSKSYLDRPSAWIQNCEKFRKRK